MLAPSFLGGSPVVSARAQAGTASARRVASTCAVAVPVTKEVKDFKGGSAGSESWSFKTTDTGSGTGLVHRAFVREMANVRAGTASTLTRGEVSGGGKKPLKQKGSGNARMGSTRTPLRPGGGITFGPKPRKFHIDMNKKERSLAMGTALLSKAGVTTVVTDFEGEFAAGPKTSTLVGAMAAWGIAEVTEATRTLLVLPSMDENTVKSGRNVEYLKVVTPDTMLVGDVLVAKNLVFTQSALKELKARFGAE